MMNKKKILALALAVCVIAVVSFTTLAYFTDSDSVTNTFTIGSIEIETKEDFIQDSTLIPVGSNDTPEDDENFVDKVVYVANTGNNPAYVRTFVAIPAALDNPGPLYVHDVYTDNWVKTYAGETPIEGAMYHVYCYTYQDQLAADENTYPLMDGVYIDAATDLNVYRDADDNITAAYFVWEGQEITSFDVASMKLNVYVATQAVQAEGFADAQSALTAAFGSTIPAFGN